MWEVRRYCLEEYRREVVDTLIGESIVHRNGTETTPDLLNPRRIRKLLSDAGLIFTGSFFYFL